MIAWKFLSAGGRGLLSGFRWPPPRGTRPGAWVRVQGPLEPGRVGVHAPLPHDLMDWIDDELWLIELADPNQRAGVLVARRGRLVRRVRAWDASAATGLAEACAARARARAARLARRGSPSAPEAAGYARDAEYLCRGGRPDGPATLPAGRGPTPAAIAANVAFVAARGAGYARAGRSGSERRYRAGFAAERAWQGTLLAERIGPDPERAAA